MSSFRVKFYELLREELSKSSLQSACLILDTSIKENYLNLNNSSIEDAAFIKFIHNVVIFYNENLWEMVGRNEIIWWIDKRIERIKTLQQGEPA